MKKNIRIIVGIAGAAFVCAGLLVVSKKIIAIKKMSAVTTYTVRREKYENVINVAGTVSAAQKQTLQALSDGTVTQVFVEQGDHVKKGDVLIQLDDTTQVYNLAKHDYDMESIRISGSKKELALKETERLSLLQKIKERKVIATFDGIIADIDIKPGNSLEAKDSVGTIVDVSYLLADVEIAETDVAKLKVGQEVDMTFPSYNGTVKGRVVKWPAIGEITSRGATVVKVRLRIDDYPETILPNFSFSGKIKISPSQDFILVERYALGRENKKAFVVKKDTKEKIYVDVQPYGREFVKIISGDIKEGDVLLQQNTPGMSGKKGTRNGPPPEVAGVRSGPGSR